MSHFFVVQSQNNPYGLRKSADKISKESEKMSTTTWTACTNPIYIKVGTLSKNAIKTKDCNLLNHLNFYLADKCT